MVSTEQAIAPLSTNEETRSLNVHRQPLVVVVDDDDELRHLLVTALKLDGFRVVDFDDATRASEYIGASSRRPDLFEVPDLVITDLLMPESSGFELIGDITHLVRCVAITAFGDDEVHQAAMRRGATWTINKPIQLSALRELVGRLTATSEEES